MVDLAVQMNLALDAPATVSEALKQRLLAVSPHLFPNADLAFTGHTTMTILKALSVGIADSTDHSRLWLLMTALAGIMPTRHELVRGYRYAKSSEIGSEHLALLRACSGMASVNENFGRTIRVVADTVIFDVDFSARHGHNTGIQRVVRETARRWAGVNDFTPIAWTNEGYCMRSLVADELRRVVDWTSARKIESSSVQIDFEADLVVPWNCRIILPEVAQLRIWERMASLAEFSNNRVVAVGYDAIPVSSAVFVNDTESERFVRYLSIIKYSDRVIGISETSSEEFAGFAAALRAQGLRGPDVVTVSLPVALPAHEKSTAAVESASLPLVICVGTQEPRKNQIGVLTAAELLWQQGLKFELLFIGAAAMPLSVPFDIELERLRKLGRTVSVKRQVDDATLESAYRRARFSIFVSMHEGYGLPVGESLAAGTPAITTQYGSTAEIALAGGCLIADPRDDHSVAAAMKSLLTDNELLERLTREAAARPKRTWDDYADELWITATKIAANYTEVNR